MDIKEIRYEAVNWTHWTPVAVRLNMVNQISGSIKGA
jgi:hypothetical protein